MRHTSVAIEKGVCYGQLDVDLKDTFEQEAQAIVDQLPNDFDVVISSPLSRCTKLAQTFSQKEIQQDARLMEVNFGAWEGMPWDDIDPSQLNKWMADFVDERPPQGESASDLYRRVADFMDALRSSAADKALIVAHAGSIRAIVAYILDFPIGNMFRVQLDYGSIVRIKLGKTATQDALLALN